MRYLSDTTYLIDLINGERGAVELASELDRSGEKAGLSVISVQEYLRGIFYLYWNDEKALRRKLAEARVDISAFEILGITYEVAEKAAYIDAQLARKGQIIGYADLLIAATALTYGLVLITRDLEHFSRVEGLDIREY